MQGLNLPELDTWRLSCFHGFEMWKLFLLIAVGGLLILGSALSTQSFTRREYAGVEKCRLCHREQYQLWKKSKHSRATSILPREKRNKHKCLRCHGTGYIDPLPGVQCEACHGRGRHFSYDFVMKDKELSKAMGRIRPRSKTCRRCHLPTAPNLKPFNYKVWRQAIKHWKAKD